VIHQWGEASGAAKYRGSVWIPRRYVLAAAADHCLTAAYRGECPGVDPDDARLRTALAMLVCPTVVAVHGAAAEQEATQ
jgi:hypothetical protein